MGERESQKPKTHICVGLLAHVDAGKTTLSEALLYTAGAKRTLGRVDHGDAMLDTHALERARGITIFSKQALLQTGDLDVTILDTPGHVDFAAETERTLAAMDCAVLVISGSEGVQAHTLTLWRLLERRGLPTFLFINKMDLAGADRAAVLAQLQSQLSAACVDFQEPPERIAEAAALCDEALLESYLAAGTVTQGNLRGLAAERKLFPCVFGSALKLEGVRDLLDLLRRFAPRITWPQAFAARVYKISRDPQGTRLTWLKITGGSLKVRDLICYVNRSGEPVQEKALRLRRYSADKFTALEEAPAGMAVAVEGLTQTWAGQTLGAEPEGQDWAMEPVMTYRVNLPAGADPAQVLPRLRQLEEEDPQLRLQWENGQIQARIMGRVQLEIFRSLVKQRFGLDVTLEDPRIFYKETIENTVEGVGHYEPLRHYAEVHLLLEPLAPGSGLVFDTVCPTDVLEAGYQRLVLTHLAEKVHRGVLMGAPLTDVKITLLVGKAHLKHTEGGDFRQATYRAVRQGLMQAKSRLLEPWYAFTLTLPTEQIGRAITDIRAMGGEFGAPEAGGAVSTLSGLVPASELKDYADTLAAYTQGRGRLQLTLQGYRPCHDQEAVVSAAGYDPEADLDNTPDSVFCAHGAGFLVKWNAVRSYMHLDSGLGREKPPALLTGNLGAEDRELEKIMEREFGPIRRPQYGVRAQERPAAETVVIRQPRDRCLIVDGYNVIFALEDLAALAREDLDAARRSLCDRLSSYAGFTKVRLILVFDGYKRKGNPGQKETCRGIQVVYTREGQTADAYIEALADQIGQNYAVRVVTNDALVQLSSFRSGVLRMSVRELELELDQARARMEVHFGSQGEKR